LKYWLSAFESEGVLEKNPDLTYSLTDKGRQIWNIERQRPHLSEGVRRLINMTHTRQMKEVFSAKVAALEDRGLALDGILAATRANAKVLVPMLRDATLIRSIEEAEEEVRAGRRTPGSKRMRALERKLGFLREEKGRRGLDSTNRFVAFVLDDGFYNNGRLKRKNLETALRGPIRALGDSPERLEQTSELVKQVADNTEAPSRRNALIIASYYLRERARLVRRNQRQPQPV